MAAQATVGSPFVSPPAAFDELRIRLAEVSDVQHASGLLFWDQRTKMPPAGSEGRAEQVATLGRIAHERFVDAAVGRLLEELRPYEDSLPRESFEASLIRVARRDWEKATCVPPSLTAEMRRAGALGFRAWSEARAASDFSPLAPHLERNLELKHRYVACFPPAEETYDILLDDYEPGMKTAEVRAVFDELKRELIPLVRAAGLPEPTPLLELPRDGQERFARRVLDRLGFDERSWRLDETAHPFMSSPGSGDVRLTTRWEPGLNWLFGAIHEFGHGVYEHDIDPALARTPLGGGVSLGLHESQSRTWENLVGRSRPFWRFFYPQLQDAFPEHFGGLSEDDFGRMTNRVEPSLIRVDADEVTYNLHIILRFELEQEMITGRLSAADVPEAWDAKMMEYLGVEVPDVADGALQDTHWAGGAIGYFSTYALGNITSAQLWERISADIPDVYEQIGRAEFAPLREWLREHVHQHGRKYMPKELLERVTGSSLDPQPLLKYLRAKLGEIYGLTS